MDGLPILLAEVWRLFGVEFWNGLTFGHLFFGLFFINLGIWFFHRFFFDRESGGES